MSYAEKYKDPRWQKKRLEILERDEWTCQRCLGRDKQLHVHHRVYVWGEDPWEAPDGFLTTLCDKCHEAESHPDGRKAAQQWLTQAVCGRLLSHDVAMIAEVLDRYLHVDDVERTFRVYALRWFMSQDGQAERLADMYMDSLRERAGA